MYGKEPQDGCMWLLTGTCGVALAQDELLDSAATLVRPGGVLVYSTCSIEEEEGRLRVAAFLSRNESFAVERPAAGQLPEAVVTEEGFLTTLPHVHGTDGAFAARMRRTG
jgi:16S rRNA (cytosine967-C5)-methyltransferase